MSLPDSDCVALYIHIPFCLQKCRYCSFVSYAGREQQWEEYVAALKHELGLRLKGNKVRTIYFGGGTPSLLRIEQLGEILNYIDVISPLGNIEEISLEANPGTVAKKYLVGLRKIGINRLSLGVQSFDDRRLALLGRIHNSRQAKEAIRFARQAGFHNLNLDIIYGIPGQTLAAMERTLREVIECSPEHISLYPLTLEEDTPLWRSIENGEIPPLDADLAADQYEMAEDILGMSGYEHYEISNWAKHGFECRHNLTYWLCQPYIGAGVAAHSYIAGYRLANTADLDKYIAAFSDDNANFSGVFELNERINPDMQLSEAVIMGLRLSQGINPDMLRKRFGINLMDCYHNTVEEMTGSGLLEYCGGNLRLTRRGRLLGNEVFQRFLPV